MKKIVIVASSLLLSFSAIANEPKPLQPEDTLNQTLTVAPEEDVKDVTETCRSWAKEVGVESGDLAMYLLDCVNDELQDKGFLPVTTIGE